jgi:uncharacterized protein (DUF1697 family)
MNTYIALFRGINVGGKNSLPMEELIAIFKDLSAKNIKAYIQSGNIVFETMEKNILSLPKKISAEIKKRRNFEPYVLLLKLAEIEKVIADNPFPDVQNDPSSLHVGFLAFTPENPDLVKMQSLKKKSERFHLSDKIFYLYAPEGVGRSKLAASAERLLGVPMTDRNWKTVCKIRNMAKG